MGLFIFGGLLLAIALGYGVSPLYGWITCSSIFIVAGLIEIYQTNRIKNTNKRW